MTEKNLFDFDDYRAYLRQFLDQSGARSGLRAKLANSLGCQSSFISQVLSGSVDLSLEQAFKANAFLQHGNGEAHFFMLLVQFERAGSADLKAYYRSQIEELRADRAKIKTRLATTKELSETEQARYYSHADYVSVHMALAVPALQNTTSLAQALGLTRHRVEQVLEFLLRSGLARSEGSRLVVGDVHLHLGLDSPFLPQHHSNWRVEAMKRMNSQNSGNFHYSGAYSLSRKDFDRLRENLLQVVEKNLAVVKPSPEQIVVCQNIDLMVLTHHDD